MLLSNYILMTFWIIHIGHHIHVCHMFNDSESGCALQYLCSLTTFSPFTVSHPRSLWEQHKTFCHKFMMVPLPETFSVIQRAEFNDVLKAKWFTDGRSTHDYCLAYDSFLTFNLMHFLCSVNNADGDDYIFMIVLCMQICPA